MNKHNTLQELIHYGPMNETDGDFRIRTLQFMENNDAFWQRSTLEGHLTGSAWVVSPDYSQVLLIHHAKLDKWFQPGGHADETDAGLWETARREAIEECGLTELYQAQAEVFDIDIHPIPAKGEVPEHLHYDIRYLFTTPQTDSVFDALEIKGMKWVPVESLCGPETPEGLRRMALKTAKNQKIQ